MNDYGVSEITPEALSDFLQVLDADHEMNIEYQVRKMGFDPNNSVEAEMAKDIYKDKDLITSGKEKTGEFFCSMSQSLSPQEFNDCCAVANN